MIQAVRAAKVSKTWGRHRALADVSASFAPGRIAALLGPNGAGKSTLLGILSTLVSPTSGMVLWGSEHLGRSSPARASIGWVGHEPGLYGDLGAPANLLLFAELHGVPEPGRRADELLGRVGLGEAPRDRPIRTFSRGMQQRLALARALLHRPSLLLLDEPGSALDPAGASWLARELRAEREAGRVVVLVTHDLDAAGSLADHVLVLRRGRVSFDEVREGAFGPDEVRRIYAEKAGD